MSPAPLRAPGLLLGLGMGGFVDGILLHQILQWHHMLSSSDTDRVGVPTYLPSTLRGLEVNTLWDGFFHAFTWVAVLAGLVVLSRRSSAPEPELPGRVWSSRALWGWVLVGWGVFNLVEGLVDHHLLAIHHVRGGPDQTAWDLAFLALGALLVAGGWLLQRTADRAVSPVSGPPAS